MDRYRCRRITATRIPVIVAGRACPHAPTVPAHVALERCPMTSDAGFSSVVGVAESRKGSTELAPPPHSCRPTPLLGPQISFQPGGSDVH
jgi:hypothetical protein